MLAPTIETERLILRAPALEDWEPYAASWADPRMTRFIGGEPRERMESWTKFLGSAGLWPLLGYGYWSFIDRANGAYLGTGGLAQFERGVPELEGYPEAGWAFVPDAWGRGLASEAVAAICAWADGTLDAPEIRCIIDPGNIASEKVATRNGFGRLAPVAFRGEQTVLYARSKGG